MKEHLFEKRIIDVRDSDTKYKALVFKVTYGTYELGKCYVLSASELANIDPSLYIIDYSLNGLLDKVRREHKTQFSPAELREVLGQCWITLNAIIDLKEPVLADDGHICEKDEIICYQDARGGFAVAMHLSDRSTRLTILIPHLLISLIKNAGDLTQADQTSLSLSKPIRFVNFMEFLDTAVTQQVQEIAPNHPGLLRFQKLIHYELYEHMPQVLPNKQDQLEFFSSPGFIRLWNNYRRMLRVIKNYGWCEAYVNFADGYIIPALVTTLAAIRCTSLSPLALAYLLPGALGVGALMARPLRNGTNFLCSWFYSPELKNDDGLDLAPFIAAMRKNLAADAAAASRDQPANQR